MVNSVSTLGMAYRSRMMVSIAQSEAAKISGEIGSGFKSDVAGSIGTRLGDDIKSRNMFNEVEGYKNNITLLQTRLDTMAGSFAGVEETVSSFFGKLATMQGDSQMKGVMKQEAISSIAAVLQNLNTVTGDRYLFSGVDISVPPMQSADKVNPATGMSPLGAMAGMHALYPATDAVSAQALVDYINAAFENDPAVPVAHQFEGTFYNGTPKLDGAGDTNPRVSGRVDTNRTLDYGVQGNDDGFRNILKGVYMIASMDMDMSADAYELYVSAAYQAIGTGLTAMREDVSVLAGYQKDTDSQTKIHDNAIKLMNNKIVELETVDLVEANARMTILETQLQASIVMTNKMSSLTIASLMVGR